MVPAWVAQYVDIPFKEKGRNRSGCDCWGLVRLIWGDQFGIQVPSFVNQYISTKDNGIGSLVEENMDPWTPVPAGMETLGDGVLLRIEGRPKHVGIVLEPGRMIHCAQDVGTVIEKYRTKKWERRIIGFYRYG